MDKSNDLSATSVRLALLSHFALALQSRTLFARDACIALTADSAEREITHAPKLGAILQESEKE